MQRWRIREWLWPVAVDFVSVDLILKCVRIIIIKKKNTTQHIFVPNILWFEV